MKPDIRWQLVLAVVCCGLLATLFVLQTRPETDVQAAAPETESTTPSSSPSTETDNDISTACLTDQGGLLIEGMIGAPQYLNPLLSDRNPVDAAIADLLFDGLLRYDKSGRLIPALATEWMVSEDGRTVTFALRDNVFWHDGEPFTAADVAFTYGLFQDETFPISTQDAVLWQSAEIRVVDDLTIAFTLPNPYSPFLAATTRGIVPEHILGDVPAADLGSAEFNQRPIGTGPFMVTNDWSAEGQLLLQPNPYSGQAMGLDGLAYRFYPDEGALLEAFAADEVNALQRLSPSMVATAAVLPHMRLYTTPANSYTQLLFNLSASGSAAGRDLAVRQALHLGTDKEALIDAAIYGQALPFAGPYLPTGFAYDPNMPPSVGYDPDAAAAVLDEAGWLLPDETATDSVRLRPSEEEDEAPELLTLTLLALDNAATRRLTAEIQTQWAEIGVDVEAEFVTAVAFQEALATRAFDVALVQIVPPGDPDLYDFWSQEAIIRGQNYAGWNNRRASEALEAARQVWDQDERLAFYRAFLNFYADEVPAITLFQPVYSYGVSEYVRNVDIGLIDRPRSRYETIGNWFVATDEELMALAECTYER